MKKYVVSILSILVSVPTMAMTISGRVIDAQTNEPLIGVSIYPEDTTNLGAITDLDGNFTMDNFPDGEKVVISYIGYKTQTLSPGASMGTISLAEDSQLIDEVLVTAPFKSAPCNETLLAAINAKSGQTARDANGEIYCVPDSCIHGYKYNRREKTCEKLNCVGPRYVLNEDGDDCVDMDGKKCQSSDKNARRSEYEWDGTDLKCTITKCNKNYVPSDDGTKCELSAGTCTPDQLAQIANATSGELKNKICHVTECESGYKVNKDKNQCDKLNCTGRYKLNAAGDECEDQDGKKCQSSDKNAKKSEYEWDGTDLKCIIKKCNKGYLPSDDGTICEASSGPCSDAQVAAIEHATAGELKRGECRATECENGFEPDGGKCVAISGDCDPMPDDATRAHREWDSATGTEICIVDECADGFSVSSDKRSCIEPTLSEEDSQKKINELQENAYAMHEKEQSTANKLLGGASIGAMGIGGMQTASAIAEKRADEEAERDMAAYIATFRCDFGQGRNIQGGETEIALPGASELSPLYTEFMELAADLKIRKEALGLRAGIESEVIIDSATTGLYDDVSLGKTDGAYTSLYRALTDSDSADAAEWAEQKSDTASQLKTGATSLGVGAVASVAGNLLINRNAPEEKSDEINAKYEPLKKLRDDVSKLPDQESNAKCPSDATGTFPNCVCTNTKNIYNSNTNACEPCPGDKTAIDGKCQCTLGTVPGDNDTCTPAQVDAKCDTSDPHISVDPTTGICVCTVGWKLTDDGQRCECPAATHEVNAAGFCQTKKTTAPAVNLPIANSTPLGDKIADIIPQGSIQEKIELSTSNLFALNSSTLVPAAQQTIRDFYSGVVAQGGTKSDYCITVVGHTDHSGGDAVNIPLSQKRADAVKTALASAGFTSSNIKSSGQGSTQCPQTGSQYNKSCRKVTVEFSNTKCPA